MKKLMIAATAALVLVVGAFAAVAIGSSGTAAAQTDESETETTPTEAPTTADADSPEWVNDVLDGLVTGGIITQDSADQLQAEAPNVLSMLEQMGLNSDSTLPETESLFPLDIERLRDQFGALGLPEGLDPFGPDGFNIQDLRDQFENFDFENFELPEGLDHPGGISPESFGEFRFPGGVFGFLDSLNGLSFADLRDAMQNGTLGDLLDVDAIVSTVTDRLDAAVADGNLTREQADEKLQWLTEKLDAIGSGEFPFPDHGPDSDGTESSFESGGPHPLPKTDVNA